MQNYYTTNIQKDSVYSKIKQFNFVNMNKYYYFRTANN